MKKHAHATSCLSGDTSWPTFLSRLLSLSGGGSDSFCFQPTSHQRMKRSRGLALAEEQAPEIGSGRPSVPTAMADAAAEALNLAHRRSGRRLRAGACAQPADTLNAWAGRARCVGWPSMASRHDEQLPPLPLTPGQRASRRPPPANGQLAWRGNGRAPNKEMSRDWPNGRFRLSRLSHLNWRCAA